MRVLVGYNGSDGAVDAVELARGLCGDGDEVLLVNVIPGGGPVPVAYGMLGFERAEARQFFDAARARLGDLEVETRTYAGESPSESLTELSENDGVDLVVVGSPHRGPLGRTFLGSVSEKLLYGAAAPIAIAPHGYAGTGLGDLDLIAVAYDGGAESKLALARAIAVAKASGACLRVLTVESPLVLMPGPIAFTPPVALDSGEVIEEAMATIGSAVEAEGRRLNGPCAGALAEACEDEVDLLLAGSRGYGPLGRVFIGSVTASLICKSPCPVVVVPRAQPVTNDGAKSTRTTTSHGAANALPG